MKYRTIVAAIAVSALPMMGLAQEHGHGAGGHMSHGTAAGTEGGSMRQMMEMMQPKPDDTPFVRDFKQAHLKMMRDMHFPLSGDPDRDFVRHMIAHHQGAIDAARVQLQHGKDPEMRKLAESIIQDQEREIAQMNAWSGRNAK